jgi:DNA-binding MarR family transcriptional regulator
MTAVPARGKTIRLGPLTDYAGYHLRLAQDASFQAFVSRVGGSDIRPGYFTLLMLMRENPGITQTAISQASGRDKSTLTPAMRYLEDNGYVERRRAPSDRRAYGLYLTPLGEEAIAQLSRHASAHDADLDRIIGAERKAEFIGILRDIVAALSNPQSARE